ncbi:MAG: HPF/RaiA family ribosome-associated protein [Patescibacteria group bacterium]|nr:HPF/RaiA family ribosome-associated protein [Patescibacteria group bacterium]
MKIVIKTKNLKLNRALEKFIEEKMNSLEKFSKIFYTEKYYNSFFGKGKPKVEVWVEVGKTTLYHQKGPWFYAKCQMRFPKKNLRSLVQREDLKLAINEVKDKLQRELKQYKEKPMAEFKRGARVFKKKLKLSPLARFWRKGRIREEGI